MSSNVDGDQAQLAWSRSNVIQVILVSQALSTETTLLTAAIGASPNDSTGAAAASDESRTMALPDLWWMDSFAFSVTLPVGSVDQMSVLYELRKL